MNRQFVYIFEIHNQEEVLQDNLDLLIKNSSRLNIKGLVLVDHGSTDRSLEICSIVHKRAPKLKIFTHHLAKFDQGEALHQGLGIAIKNFSEQDMYFVLTRIDLPLSFADIEELHLRKNGDQSIYSVSRLLERDKTKFRKVILFFQSLIPTVKSLLLGMSQRQFLCPLILSRQNAEVLWPKMIFKNRYYFGELLFQANELRIPIEEIWLEPDLKIEDETKLAGRKIPDYFSQGVFLVELALTRWQTAFKLCLLLCLFFIFPLFYFNENIAGVMNHESSQRISETSRACQQATNEALPPPSQLKLACQVAGNNSVGAYNLIIAINIILIFFMSLYFAQKFIHNPLLQVSFVILTGLGTFFQSSIATEPRWLSILWMLPLVFALFLRINFKKPIGVWFTFLVLGFCISMAPQMNALLWPLVLVLVVSEYIQQTRAVNTQALLKMTLTLAGGIGIAYLLVSSLGSILGYDYSLDQGKLPETIALQNRMRNMDFLSWITPAKQSSIFAHFTQLFQQENLPNDFLTSKWTISFDWMILFLLPFAFQSFVKIRHRLEYFILASIALFYALIAMGSQFRFANKILFNFDAYEFLSKLNPSKDSFAPEFYALISIFIMSYLVILAIDKKLSQKSFKYYGTLVPLFILLASATSTGLWGWNRHVKITNYAKIIPVASLENLAKQHREGALILSIPVDNKSDPTQNFLQIFHKMNLLNNFYFDTRMNKFTDVFVESRQAVKNLNCTQPLSEFKNADALFEYLRKNDTDYIIINKKMLAQASCSKLNQWVDDMLAKSKHLNLTTQNDYFALYSLVNN